MAEQMNQGHNPPNSKRRDEELYAQIAAGDEVEIQTKHNKSSLVMSLMIEYMRLTLLIDEKRRQYQKFFRFLGSVWSSLMVLLYSCGVVAFGVLVVSYMRFPSVVQDYLNKNGIMYSRMDIPGYIVSQIDLYDLHDKDNTYRIDKLSVSSTFSDFLNKRARALSVKGVQITLDKERKNATNIFGVLTRLNHQADFNGGLRIDSLEVSDATLIFKGKNYTIPVSFQLMGIYGRETNLSAFITVNQPNLKIHGPLSVRNSDQGLRWDLTIQSGQFAFPGRPLENLSGQLSAQMKYVQLKSITADLTLVSERLKKTLNVFLEREKEGFGGKVALKWMDTSVKSKPVERTGLDLNLTGLSILPTGEIKTQKPVKIDFSTTYNPDFSVKGVSGMLKGELTCQLFDKCAYQLKSASNLMIKEINVLDQGYFVRNDRPVTVSLEPTKEFLNVSFKTGLIQFDLNSKRFNFKGKQIDTKNDVSLTTAKSHIWGSFNFLNKLSVANLSLSDLSYKNPSVELNKGLFYAEDLWGRNGRSYLSGLVALKNNSYFKTPFDLTYSNKEGISNLVLEMENKQIQALFQGKFDLAMGTLDGQLVVPAVDLGKLRQPLNRISDLFPPEIKSIEGVVSAYGRLSGNVYSQLNGPFYVSLADLGLVTDKLNIQHLSTSLAFQSLNPFVTEPNQKVYIGQINSFIPILNVEASLKTEENYVQLMELSAEISGVKLYAGESLVPYKNVGTLIYLRNKNDDFSQMVKKIQLKDWKLSGNARGNILLPIEIKDMALTVKNATMQLSDVVLRYSGSPKKKPNFLGKSDQISIRSGNVIIDSDSKSADDIKITMVLDTLLEPQKLKKTIREVFVGKLSDAIRFLGAPSLNIPLDIKESIRRIQDQTKAFRVK